MTDLNLVYQEALRLCELHETGGTAWCQEIPA